MTLRANFLSCLGLYRVDVNHATRRHLTYLSLPCVYAVLGASSPSLPGLFPRAFRTWHSRLSRWTQAGRQAAGWRHHRTTKHHPDRVVIERHTTWVWSGRGGCGLNVPPCQGLRGLAFVAALPLPLLKQLLHSVIRSPANIVLDVSE